MIDPYSPEKKCNRLFCLADDLAATLLEGVVDKQGVPLIIHARNVCNRCRDLSDEQRIAALLHDVLEDGSKDSFNAEEISRTIIGLFGWQVAIIVNALTRKEGETYNEYIRNIHTRCAYATPVKLADLEDNLDESRGPIPELLRQRYERARDYLRSMSE